MQIKAAVDRTTRWNPFQIEMLSCMLTRKIGMKLPNALIMLISSIICK